MEDLFRILIVETHLPWKKNVEMDMVVWGGESSRSFSPTSKYQGSKPIFLDGWESGSSVAGRRRQSSICLCICITSWFMT